MNWTSLWVVLLLVITQQGAECYGIHGEGSNFTEPIIAQGTLCTTRSYDNKTEQISLQGCGLDEDNLFLNATQELSSLKFLDLSNNMFKDFPDVLKGLYELRLLDLSRNAIVNIQKGSFNDLS